MGLNPLLFSQNKTFLFSSTVKSLLNFEKVE